MWLVETEVEKQLQWKMKKFLEVWFPVPLAKNIS